MKPITGTTYIAGVIGNPIGHTKSPAIHNMLAEETGYDLAYGAFPVETGRLQKAIEGAWALGIKGLNITVPYKQEVIPFLSEIDPLAARIGAVNTLVRTDEGFKGYNTDMPGLLRAFERDGVSIKDEDVLVLGAGGVARAVVMLLEESGARSVTIINRNTDRAEELAGVVNEISGRNFARPLPIGNYGMLPEGAKYIVIQATSVGMSPDTGKAVIEDPAFYEKVRTGYDLIFNPKVTRFMELCGEAGADSYNGSRMLLYQGIIAYEHWTGLSISDELADKVYEKVFS
ncbi:MAG: shikimate dehydrogenase [Lachnospiraceae bacterium]|nr:shikimate dehydrogenase [Lachnospiraceae bacterium]